MFIGSMLLYISWPPYLVPFAIFFALIPILIIEEQYTKSNQKNGSLKLFGYCYLMFLIWNILTTWWVFNASGAASIAIGLNSLFMCIPILLFHKTRKKFNRSISLVALVCFWLAFEHLHLRWDISWPWLTLGNVFAKWPSLIQWYEYTGFIGGTVWVWIINILLANIYIRFLAYESTDAMFKQSQYFKRWILIYTLCLVIPIVWSQFIFYNYQAATKSIEVVIVQPNIDPYTEKFDGLTAEQQLRKMLLLAEQKIDSNVNLLILPETAITSTSDEANVEMNEEVMMLRRFQEDHPKVDILTGISTYKIYEPHEKISQTAHLISENKYADYYNTAILLSTSVPTQIYHKSKLVPGVEKMPFPSLLKFLEDYSINNGGISGSLGVDPEPLVLSGAKVNIAPVICYESIYGDYVRQYIKSGANIIAIITNDGWWGNTDGYKQHFDYGAMRAIETRRSIARSANTGISGFIDERGVVLQKSEWWKADVIRRKVTLNEKQTFYVTFGDYISLIGVLFSGMFIIVLLFIKKKNQLLVNTTKDKTQ